MTAPQSSASKTKVDGRRSEKAGLLRPAGQTSLSRRGLIGFLTLSPTIILSHRSTAETSGIDEFDSLLADTKRNPATIAPVLGYKEYLQFPIDGGVGEEKTPITAKPSTTKISQKATDLIIFFEVSDKAAYVARYQRPTLPPGDSGITIGMGYDIGYSSPALLRSDWQGFLHDENMLADLAGLCGRTGSKAAPLLKNVQWIAIPYDVAYQQFVASEQPKYIGLTERSLPNFDRLSEDSRGALVSLVYNRGPSFRQEGVAGDRYTEMRNILELMTIGSTESIRAITAEIRGMSRIWADPALDMRGLVTRRNLEADLFKAGL